jgi:hypothetical protein
MRNQCWCLTVWVLLFVVSGCNSGLRTEYVEGVVTLDGEPIEGALVTFHPSGEETLIAAGDTDANGKYVLTAPEGGKPGRGTTLGDYKVTISKRKPTVDTSVAAEPVKLTGPPSAQEMAAGDMARRQAGLPPPFAYITPKEYNNPKTSGFTATVVRGKNRFNFDMVSN